MEKKKEMLKKMKTIEEIHNNPKLRKKLVEGGKHKGWKLVKKISGNLNSNATNIPKFNKEGGITLN